MLVRHGNDLGRWPLRGRRARTTFGQRLRSYQRTASQGILARFQLWGAASSLRIASSSVVGIFADAEVPWVPNQFNLNSIDVFKTGISGRFGISLAGRVALTFSRQTSSTEQINDGYRNREHPADMITACACQPVLNRSSTVGELQSGPSASAGGNEFMVLVRRPVGGRVGGGAGSTSIRSVRPLRTQQQQPPPPPPPPPPRVCVCVVVVDG